jgi:hypothetical protein
MTKIIYFERIWQYLIKVIISIYLRDRRGRDLMLVGFTTTCAINAYHHKLWFQSPFMTRCTRYTVCDKVCQWLSTGRWFSPGTAVSSTNKTDIHDITEILLNVVLATVNLNIKPQLFKHLCHENYYPICKDQD